MKGYCRPEEEFTVFLSRSRWCIPIRMLPIPAELKIKQRKDTFCHIPKANKATIPIRAITEKIAPLINHFEVFKVPHLLYCFYNLYVPKRLYRINKSMSNLILLKNQMNCLIRIDSYHTRFSIPEKIWLNWRKTLY